MASLTGDNTTDDHNGSNTSVSIDGSTSGSTGGTTGGSTSGSTSGSTGHPLFLRIVRNLLPDPLSRDPVLNGDIIFTNIARRKGLTDTELHYITPACRDILNFNSIQLRPSYKKNKLIGSIS